MSNALTVLGVGIAAVAGFLLLRRSRESLGSSLEEGQLIDRAAEGDEGAAQELVRRGKAEEDALKARAATDRGAARQFLERKQQQLQALEWAKGALEEKAALAGYSAEKTAEVRARIENSLREAASDIRWARERSGQA